MITEFTFICICYNQENEITEHLNSIKRIVNHYGAKIDNYLIVADDCSKDNTRQTALEWLSHNKTLFKQAEVLPTVENVGTVKNIFRAVDACKTRCFKILAGDDKYNDYNIYDLYSRIGNEIVVTPVIPFGQFDNRRKELIQSFKRSYRLLMAYNKKGNIGELLLFRNYIFAPGVFFSSDYWNDKEIRAILSRFQYVEDTPMWMNLIYQRKTEVRFEPTPYISYRVAGNEMLESKRGVDIRYQDSITIQELFPQRLLNRRKYLHLGFYKFLFVKLFYTFSARYDSFFKMDKLTEETYSL